MLHVGHIDLFRFCQSLSGLFEDSKVIVGVNTDGFIFRYKGKLPIVSEADRLTMIQACKYVDGVHYNPQDGLGHRSIRSFLEHHHIKVLVVGSDWMAKDYLSQVGLTMQDCEELGLYLVYKPYFQGISSTDLRDRIATQSSHAKLPKKGRGTLTVIASHNPNHLLAKATENLKSFVVVDNGSTQYNGFRGVPFVESNSYGPTYEVGALLHAYEHYVYDRYFLVQDSIVLSDSKFLSAPESFFEDADGVYALTSIDPASTGMAPEEYSWIQSHCPHLDGTDFGQEVGIQYCSFSISRPQLKKLIDSGYLAKEYLPDSKVGSQSWERILGVAFRKLGMPVHHLTTCHQANHSVFTKTFLGRL